MIREDPMSNESLLTRDEVGKLLRISVRSVDRLRKDGYLRGLRIGARRVFRRSEVEMLIQRLHEKECGQGEWLTREPCGSGVWRRVHR